MRNVRVALCQLESHPAIYGGHVAFAEEPFVPLGDRWSLSRLGNKGIDVHTLQDYCKTEYLKWSEARLRSVVAFLKTIQPPPDIVLFPEGAIPLESIGHLKEWSSSVGTTVLAGTHAVEQPRGAASLHLAGSLADPPEGREQGARRIGSPDDSERQSRAPAKASTFALRANRHRRS